MNRIVPTLLALALLIACAAALPARAAAPPAGTTTRVSPGTLGPHRIALDLTVRDGTTVLAGHYFYADHLQDIPLTVKMDGQTLVLQEPGGGVFRLYTVGDQFQPTRTFDLYRSLGFGGTWSQAGRTLPVTLRGGYDGPAPGHRWYAQVTDEPDAVFEARVRRFLHGVLTGDRAAAAREVAYPLRVNRRGARTQVIRSPHALLAQWNEVFTPRLIARMRLAVPHEMFVHNGEAMLLDGELWFFTKGLTAINEP